jgi:hypothetical protein
MLKEDAIALAGIGLLGYLLLKGLANITPQVVKDGLEASGQLGLLAFNGVAHPLDTFGISPNTFADGTPKYIATAPVEYSAPTQQSFHDPIYDITGTAPGSTNVTDNNLGYNFNYF